jgi:hypothetical protein
LYSICLTEDRVGHVVRVVDTVSLVKHVVCFGLFWVCRPVCVNVGPYVGEKVCPVTGVVEGRLEAREFATVV